MFDFTVKYENDIVYNDTNMVNVPITAKFFMLEL